MQKPHVSTYTGGTGSDFSETSTLLYNLIINIRNHEMLDVSRQFGMTNSAKSALSLSCFYYLLKGGGGGFTLFFCET